MSADAEAVRQEGRVTGRNFASGVVTQARVVDAEEDTAAQSGLLEEHTSDAAATAAWPRNSRRLFKGFLPRQRFSKLYCNYLSIETIDLSVLYSRKLEMARGKRRAF